MFGNKNAHPSVKKCHVIQYPGIDPPLGGERESPTWRYSQAKKYESNSNHFQCEHLSRGTKFGTNFPKAYELTCSDPLGSQ